MSGRKPNYEAALEFTPEQLAEQRKFRADLGAGTADVVFEGSVSEAKTFLKRVGELAPARPH